MYLTTFSVPYTLYTKDNIITLYTNDFYSRNKESINKATRKYLQNHQEYRLYHSTKQRASKAQIEFTITIDDITIPEFCPYLGIKITNILGEGRLDSNASVDRIDSSKGYTPDNIQVICLLANRMKQNATPEQLLAFAEGIVKIHG